ncbi:MAG: GDSL-type esterase/lipase family protein [Lautropia sp.]|nr:GDSL-type esterase/lipase family protein [Lautropia sp.]
MKYPRVAPLAGLVAAAMMLAACGGGSDDNKNNTPAPTPPGSNSGGTNPGTKPPAGGGAGAANSVVLVKQAMTGTNEGTSAEAAGVADGFAKAASAPATASALGGYGQVFTATDNTASNTRIHLRNFETYVRSAGKWKRVQFSGKLKGKTYGVGYAGAAQDCNFANGCLRAEDDGGVSFKPVAGRFLRFWPEAAFTQSLVTPAQVEAIFTTVQTRLVKDGGGADDRASAKYLVNVGAAWVPATWTATDFPRDAYPAYTSLTDAGHGRLTLVKNDFGSANFHSGSDAQVDELANPLEGAGGRAPLANSQNVRDDDDVVRLIFIGDSITQGNVAQRNPAGQIVGAAQDSFRRNLWNSLMQDPTLPMVDFVGTRTGTALSDENYCQKKTTSPDTGDYKLPEFDTDHEGYWGACVDQVNTLLTPALARLDTDAQRGEPDVALIHIGTNNLNTNAEAGVDAAITQLQSTIAELRKTNDDITILVAKVIPFLNDAGAASPLVASYNAAIEARIAPMTTAKSKIVVVDHSTFPVGQLRDRFHPNDAGEKTLADTWLAALKANNLLVDRD